MFVIGDIHGELDMLTKLYNKIKVLGEDVYCVGDMIDRGSEPIKCVEFVRDNDIKAVIGNHEEMFLEAMNAKGADIDIVGRRYLGLHLRNGGYITWDKFDELSEEKKKEIMDFLTQLPRYIITYAGKTKLYITHAGFMLDPSIGTEKSIEEDSHNSNFLWYREEYLYRNYEEADGIIITGHTPMERVCAADNRFFIDTGAVFGRPLTALRIKDNGEVEIHQYDREDGYSIEQIGRVGNIKIGG